MGLDKRLQAELQGPVDERAQPALRRVQHDEQQHRVRPGRAQRLCSWRMSTTNSLASTGTETAERIARRSSMEPPNQCGSQRTEMAAAPPAW